MDGDVRGGRRAAAATAGNVPGIALAADGQFLCLGELGHLLWMDLTPKGYKEVSRTWLFAARESWARRCSAGACCMWCRTLGTCCRGQVSAAVLRPEGVEFPFHETSPRKGDSGLAQEPPPLGRDWGSSTK